MTTFAPGAVVGRYRIVKKLGQGGMGAVFEAADVQTGQTVALKVVVSDDGVMGQRFEREARTALQVKHPNVAATLGTFREAGRLVLVVELLRGGTLRDLVRERGRLDWREAAALGAGIARGLGAIHDAGFVHRDLKPENVLRDDAFVPKITDFGLVRRAPGAAVSQALTKSGEFVGTIAYVAPEQLDGKPVGPRADLYSLGATVYDLVAGEPPFKGDSMSLVKRVLVDRPRPLRDHEPSVPEALDRLVLALLAKEPGGRPLSALAVAEELESILAGKDAPPRSRTGLLVAACVLVAVVVAGAALALGVRRTDPPPPIPAPPPPAVVTPKADPREEALAARYAKLGAGARQDPRGGSPANESPCLALEKVIGHDEPGHAGEARALVFAVRERKTVVYSGGTDSGDGFVRGWDPVSGREVFSWKSPGREIRSLAVSDDGTRAVVGTRHDRVFCLDLRGGGSALGKPLDDYADVTVGIAHDGKTAALAGGKRVLLGFDTGTGDRSPLSLPLGANPWWIKFGSDDNALFAGLDDGRLLRVDLATLRSEDRSASEFTLDEGVVKSGIVATVGRRKEVYIFDEKTFEARTHFAVHGADCAEVFGIDLFLDGRRVVTGGSDGFCEVHDVESGKLVRRFPAHPGEVNSVAVSPDGTTIATAGGDGTVRFFDAAGKEPLWLHPLATHRGGIRSVAVRDRHVLTAGDDGTVKLWSGETGALERSFDEHARGAIGAAAVSDDLVLSLGRKGDLKLWSRSAGGKPSVSETRTDPGRTPSLVVSPNGKHALVLADFDRGAKYYDVDGGGLHESEISSLSWAAAFSADSRSFAISAGREGTRVNVRDTGGASVGDIPSSNPRDFVPVVAFLPSGDLVTATANERRLQRWSLRGGDWNPAADVTLSRRPVALATTKDLVAVALEGGWIELRRAVGLELADTVDLGAADDRPRCLAFDEARRKLWVGAGRGALLRFAFGKP